MNDELIDEKFKSVNRRVDDIETEVKNIKDLTLAINTVNGKVDTLTDTMAEVKTELKEIAKKPAENWNKFYMAILCSLGTGIIGVIIGLLFT